MSRTAASLLREALETVGVRYTFGIPGVHNTEIYDELASSPSITPVLVADEGGGAFMADAVSRSGTSLGSLVIVPAAGVTHAASGIAEAYLDGIAMLVIAGGIRRDTGRRYQLHDVDQHAMLKPITKGTWLVERHADVIPTIYEVPRPYKLETGGLFEESQISQGSVFAVIPLMIVLMLLAMMVMLVSFRRMVMVVAILPLGLIGVVLSLLVFNRPLGFVAILGILALIGMIAKNALILIVSIEEERASGLAVRDAVVTCATNRFRPMMLAAMSTVLGLLPIAPTVFWGPMAFAIMGGLLVATLLTLVFLPTLYMTVFGNEKTPMADLVEPSA